MSFYLFLAFSIITLVFGMVLAVMSLAGYGQLPLPGYLVLVWCGILSAMVTSSWREQEERIRKLEQELARRP